MITFLLKYKWIILGILLVGSLVLYNIKLAQDLGDTKLALGLAKNNEKAYAYDMKKWEDRYGQEHAKTIMFNESLTDFKTNQDSITKKLVSIIKDQGYSLEKLRMASLIQTKVSTTLTKEIQTRLPDTTIDLSNKWVKNVITLSPYKISSEIEFKNDQTILWQDTTYKVFVPYRKDFFISRWLQKKYKETMVTAEVINSNPLWKIQNQKFINIFKNDK